MKLFYFLFLSVSILVWNCKPKCAGVNQRKEVYIVSDAKHSLAGFLQGTTWIFQCTSTSEKDTIIINSNPKLPMSEGSCVDNRDCCSKYYYEHLEPTFQVKSTSGLNNFLGYDLDANGFYIKSSYIGIPMENGSALYDSFPGNSFKDNLILSISGKTLNDIEVGGEYSNPTTLIYCYWSAQYGLVKYSYKTESGSLIKEFERVDIP